VKTQRALLSIAAAIVAATLGADAPGAEESSAMLSPQALQEIARSRPRSIAFCSVLDMTECHPLFGGGVPVDFVTD
jgi:hypothetical protein